MNNLIENRMRYCLIRYVANDITINLNDNEEDCI